MAKKRKKSKKHNKADNTLSFFQTAVFICVSIFIVYVIFFMPAGTGNGNIDDSSPTASVKEPTFTLYTYLNGIKSSAGTLDFNCTFNFNNGDRLELKSSKKFEIAGGKSSLLGSTVYAMNGDSAVIDDINYVIDGVRYSKSPSGYVKAPQTNLDAGNINLGKIETAMEKGENLVQEGGRSCFKYTTTMAYSEMSTELRDFIHDQNVNLSNIQDMMLDLTLFVTEKGVPYKIKISFDEAKCMVKATGLKERNGTVSGDLTITFSSFNSIESVSVPGEVGQATDGAYKFTDKLNYYLGKINY
ncbi:MAG: hypothetical protein UIM53_03135 [Acutalibacteraceae bacterium]|nr:hypothetical protein [Acutalibacteraceae bacterium]